MRCGPVSKSFALMRFLASAAEAVRNPACRPMMMFILMPGMDALSSVSAAKALATNRAAEPKPGVWSLIGRSLSTVFGTWKHRSS